MKDEIEKILDDTLRSFDEIEDIPEAADKLIHLFNKHIEEKTLKVAELLQLIFVEDDNYKSYAQDIINILKIKE